MPRRKRHAAWSSPAGSPSPPRRSPSSSGSGSSGPTPELGLRPSFVKQYSPDPDGPMIGFTWYIAADYCNWLSEQEGLPKDQWCYLPNEAGAYAEGMTIPADVLERTGYRLPTEAEWEYACRSGTVTSRYYGCSIELLDEYASVSGQQQGACLVVREPAAQRSGVVRHAGERV